MCYLQIFSLKAIRQKRFTTLLFNRLFCNFYIEINKSTTLKNSLFLILLTILFGACASLNKMTNEALYHAIAGQNEMTVRSRLGTPARTVQVPDGGKKLVYEFYSKGAPASLNKSKLTFSYSGDMADQDPHLKWQYSNVNTKTNAPEYTIYDEDTSVLEVFLNDEGQCVKFQQNMTKVQLEQFYKSFKKYIPSN